jgi:hypothetical protein
MDLIKAIGAGCLFLVTFSFAAVPGDIPIAWATTQSGGQQLVAMPIARRTFAEMAERVDRPAGFPRPSAVCFSSRWKHPTNPKDPHDTFQTAADFHVTGFYWIAGPNQEWFKEIKRRGYTVQGWLSTILPDTLFGDTRQKGRIMNEKGKLVTGPWMLSWKGWWGCLNSPEYRGIYLQYVKMYLDAGVESLQMDDPGENYTATGWGGCYCPYCKAKAARLGKSPPDIQKQSTEEFYKWIRGEMDAYAGRHVPFSCNSHPGDRYFFDAVFDFGIEELDQTTPYNFYRAMRDAQRRGKAMMYTLRSTSVPETRRIIALSYACGSQTIVPWDVYMPGPGAARYFGRPEDYADLYGMVRHCAGYLDGYEDAAFVMPELADNRCGLVPLGVVGGSADLNLFVRAVPGKADAPVVIHCLDRADAPRPFHLCLDPARLFGQRPLTIDLFVPAPYNRAAHRLAEQTKNFAPLVIRKRLAAGRVTICDVPAVSPWGLLVIAPAEKDKPDASLNIGGDSAPWPPSVIADPADAYRSTLSVRLQTVTPGAAIHYTTDGTPPVATSPVYGQPLSLTGDTTVNARCFAGDTASGVTMVSFRRTKAAGARLRPNEVSGLCLWLAADDLLASHRAGDPIARWPAKVGAAMFTPTVKLYDGRMPTPPVFATDAVNRMPVVRFASGTDLLAIPNYANENLGGAFAIFMVTRSDDNLFGMCGNALNGNGGTPRLYLMRESLVYNASRLPLGATAVAAVLSCYSHDGRHTAGAWLHGRWFTASGDGIKAVGRFGGGNLAVPFWSGNTYHSGDIAELIVFKRHLTDRQYEGIQQYLADKYRLPVFRLWE